MSKSNEINMCEGAILPKILMFAFPLILSNILQLLFNAADVVVVGRYAGSLSLAAVGSTTSLINLLVNFFIGLSIGANVIAAHFYGADDKKAISETAHTAIATAVCCGIIMVFLGEIVARPMLTLMGTPDDIIDKAVLYMRIYFCGMPAFMLYNFGAAIMRAAGDTKRPLLYLSVSGVLNVMLNILFVVVLKIDVAGVALATIISQYLSASLIIWYLVHADIAVHINPKQIKIHKSRLSQILKIGVASGLQSVVFNISNVQIQSSINSFGSTVVAGSSAASSVEGFVYMSMNAVAQTAMSFTGQNFGARKFKRIDKIFVRCILFTTIVGLIMGMGAYLIGDTLIGIYNSDPEVIVHGVYRLSIISTTYALCGIMDVVAFVLRGLGHSTEPTIISLLGACLFRVLWISFVFRAIPTQFIMYISYPISWILTLAALLICFRRVRGKLPSGDEANV
ncbi:MAG: MATE family efflux transporter [Clostridia bacterium]|nr:MATE family efflux transporter [Clostridia bacterium]